MIRTLVIALGEHLRADFLLTTAALHSSALVAAQDAAPSALSTSTRAGGPIICPREEIDGATSVEDSSSTPASDLVESSATLTSATGASTISVNSETDSSVNPETEDSLDGSDLSEIPPRCAEPCTQWNQTLYKYSQCSDKSSPSDVASGTGRSCAADKAPGARVTCEVRFRPARVERNLTGRTSTMSLSACIALGAPRGKPKCRRVLRC